MSELYKLMLINALKMSMNNKTPSIVLNIIGDKKDKSITLTRNNNGVYIIKQDVIGSNENDVMNENKNNKPEILVLL